MTRSQFTPPGTSTSEGGHTKLRRPWVIAESVTLELLCGVLGVSSKPNEVPLSSLLPGLSGAGGLTVGGGQASTEVIEAHLAVQAAIRSYQVRGHLAASIDPLGLNNMDREQAKKMIIRSVTVDAKVG